MNKTSAKISYEGKKVFVGIDVHKRSYSVVAVVSGMVVKKWRTVASPDKLAEQLRRYFPGASIHTAYEAGFSGFVLHRVLEQAGIDNIVVHPGSIEVAIHNRVKTDKRDALKIATLLEAGRLTGIRVPRPQQEQERMLTRTRQQLVEERSAIKNKIRMRCHQMGLIDPNDNREMSHKMVEEMLTQSPSQEFTLVIKAYWSVWKSIETQIRKLEQKLKEQAQTDPNEAIYRSAPGIGFLSSRILSLELGDMSQFANERQLFSYTGLTPSEFSSGDTVRKGHITHQGNRRVRCILNEAAWRAIKQDRHLKEFFERLYPRTGKKKAIVAVAQYFSFKTFHVVGYALGSLGSGELGDFKQLVPKSPKPYLPIA